MKQLFLFGLFIVLALTGCKFSLPSDSGGTELRPPQIQILSIKVEPNPIASGDTASFICVFVDSTKTGYKFYWYIPYGTPIGGKDTTYGGLPTYLTSQNHIKWKAPNKLDSYIFGVFEDNGSKDYSFVQGNFKITVE